MPPGADTRLLGRALRRERITQDTDVLELGTGSGMLAVEAARLCGRVTAVDISWRARQLNALLNGQHLINAESTLVARPGSTTTPPASNSCLTSWPNTGHPRDPHTSGH
jgi:Methylase of polypeptide chain release factors